MAKARNSIVPVRRNYTSTRKTNWKPRKKYYRKTYGSRGYNSGGSPITNSSYFINKTLFTKVKWTGSQTVHSTVNFFSASFWRLNGPYDPSTLIAPLEKSPIGWTQLALMYQRYLCYGCKIKATVRNTGVTAIRAFLFPTCNKEIAYNHLLGSLPYCQNKLLPVGVGSPDVHTFQDFKRVKQLYGQKPFSEENFAANTYGNDSFSVPNNQCFWVVGIETENALDNIFDAEIYVELKYYVKFFRPWDAQKLIQQTEHHEVDDETGPWEVDVDFNAHDEIDTL
jgi:hypothetical protein